jgi:hypothetical protein
MVIALEQHHHVDVAFYASKSNNDLLLDEMFNDGCRPTRAYDLSFVMESTRPSNQILVDTTVPSTTTIVAIFVFSSQRTNTS